MVDRLMRRLHYLQHVPFENIGSIRQWAESLGMQIRGTRLYKRELLPTVEDFDWLIIMGGPMGTSDELLYPWLSEEKKFILHAIEQHKVVLGICLGAQLIAGVLGARVRQNDHREIGWFPIHKTTEADRSCISTAIPDGLHVLHWHGDPFDLPEGAVHLWRSQACENQGFMVDGRIVGLQFHLEMTHNGLHQLIHNCRSEIDDSDYVQEPEFMLSDRQRFISANSVMDKILDCFAGRDR
jgi:GMP synthase (glutamine-hydrolysing)